MTSSRRTAAIVGLLFLIATVTFIAADTLIKGVLDRPDYLIGASGDATALAAGALLAFVDGLAVADLGGVEVRMPGRALADAQPGQPVRVQNVNSLKIVEGRADDEGMVRVDR